MRQKNSIRNGPIALDYYEFVVRPIKLMVANTELRLRAGFESAKNKTD